MPSPIPDPNIALLKAQIDIAVQGAENTKVTCYNNEIGKIIKEPFKVVSEKVVDFMNTQSHLNTRVMAVEAAVISIRANHAVTPHPISGGVVFPAAIP